MLKKISIPIAFLLLGAALFLLLVKKTSMSPGAVNRTEEVTGAAPQAHTDPLDPADDGLAAAERPPIEEAIKTLLGADRYHQRIQTAVYDLPERLDGKNAATLEAYLRTPQEGKDGDFRQHEYALRNYMMDALRANPDRLAETISTLIDVAYNARQGEVMRDYALQHLCSVYIDNCRTLPANEKQRIVQTFTAALSDPSAVSTAGVALVGLHEAARADSTFVSEKAVETASLVLLRNPESGTLSKISAFQICGERKIDDAAQMARETAFDISADWVLRMSAVYALGQLGQTAGLESLLNDQDENVSRAVRMAMNAQR